MKKTRQLLSFLIVLAMCFSLTIPAYASEGELTDTENEFEESEVLSGDSEEAGELTGLDADGDEGDDDSDSDLPDPDTTEIAGSPDGESLSDTEELLLPEAAGTVSLQSLEPVVTLNAVADDQPLTDTVDNLCGESVYWELSEDNSSLHIWGSGAMTDFASNQNMPWYGQISTITQVTVGEGVTHIGKYSFYSCKQLTSVSLPSSLTSIGDSAFSLCSVLSSVSFPAGLTSIGASAFSSCKALTNITLPAGLTSIGNYSFDSCSSLTSITLPAGLSSIGTSAFDGDTSLTEIVIPDSVTSIGTSAFSGCTSLLSVVLPQGTTALPNNLFKGCTKLSSVSIPDSVTSFGNNLFENCYGLTSLSLPQQLESIGDKAFYNCNHLTGVVLPDGLTTIGSQAFYHCSSIQSITVPASVTVCGSAFYETQLRSVVLAEGFSAIADSMFYNCPNLTSITIPNSVTSIGSSAFNSCTSLTAIDLPDSITRIGGAAFEKCTKLSEIVIPSGLTTLESSLFRKCTGLKHILIPSNITTIGNNVFAASGLYSIVIPDTVSSLGSNLFGSYDNTNCEWLESVVLPSHLTSIGNYFFRGCASLSEIELPAGITSIGTEAFANCGLKSITIPDGVTSIANGTFSGCVQLAKLTLPAGLTSIGTYALQYCRSLKDIYFKGTEAQWNAVTINYLNDPLKNGTATVHHIGTTQYAVAAFTTDMDCSASVSNITISPQQVRYPFDSEVTVSVEPAAGYTFLGWYPVTSVSGGQVTAYADTLLSGSLSYTLKVKEVNQVAAVFKPVGQASLTVHAVNGAAYTISTADGTLGGDEVDIDETFTVPLSSAVTITAKDADKVLQWENQSHKLLGKGQTLTVSVVGNMDITLVYKTESAEASSYVQFVSDYGQVLSSAWYTEGSTVTIPDSPTKFGYTFERWVFDVTEDEATAEAIQARLGTTSFITVKPQYSKDTSVFTVSVSYVSQSGRSIGEGSAAYADLEIGTRFTVEAPEIRGYLFSCWKDAAGNVLSYTPHYSILISRDTNLTACYDTGSTDVKPVITLGELYTVTSGETHKVSCQATRSVPEGYTLVEQGMLYARDVSGLTEETFVPGTEGVGQYVSSYTAQNGILKLNVKVATDNVVVSFRGYMIVRDNVSGNTTTYYTAIASGSYASVIG